MGGISTAKPNALNILRLTALQSTVAGKGRR
jgi:hypothetical protein